MQILNEQCVVHLKSITLYSTISQSISQLIFEILFKVDFEIVLRQPIIIAYPLCTGLICARSWTILIFLDQLFQDFVSSLPCPPRIIFCLLPQGERAWPFHWGWLLMEGSLNGLHTAAISPLFHIQSSFISLYAIFYSGVTWNNIFKTWLFCAYSQKGI